MVATTEQPLLQVSWQADQLDKVFTLLAMRAGWRQDAPFNPASGSPENIAAQLNINIQAQRLTYATARRQLGQMAPSILPVGSGRYVAVVGSGIYGAILLCPDSTTRRVSLRRLQTAIFMDEIAQAQQHIEAQIAELGVPEVRRAKLARALQETHLEKATRTGIWQLEAPITTGWWGSLRRSGLLAILSLQIIGRVFWYVLFFAALSILAGVAVSGRVDWAILALGALLWLSRVPLALALRWSERWLALKVGWLTKQDLFNGALKLPADDVALNGSGQFLAWLLDSERLIEAWLNRGTWFISSSLFLIVSAVLLVLVGDIASALLIVVWLLLSYGIAWWLARRYRQLDVHHTAMIKRLLERLRGHATRLVQENDWYDDSDRELAGYLRQARRRDTALAAAWTWLPYGFLLLVVLTLAPNFINDPTIFLSGDPVVTLRFAVLLFVLNEVQFLSLSLPDVARMLASWWQMQPLREAAKQDTESPTTTTSTDDDTEDSTLLRLRNVHFRYDPAYPAVLNGVDARITSGARIVMQGNSGSGKSTLAQILNGMREPQNGLVLLRGYDLPTVGRDQWRQQVVLVPQFYANHLFDASLAFNVLMGRTDSPTPDELAEAERICRELGLGALIDQMPQGMQQQVGHNGWQLSHGERNRVFIARALLQNAALIIFDESFAALDPQLLRRALRIVEAQSSAIIVISHEDEAPTQEANT